MALPTSGNKIALSDIKTERGLDENASVDFESTGIALGLTAGANNLWGDDELGLSFEEMQGRSFDTYATSITDYTTALSVPAAGDTKTVTYTSDGGFAIRMGTINWGTPSINSGSEGTGNTFTIVFDSQSLDAAQRNGTITLETPSGTNRTITVTQSANPATISITRNTGVMQYDYNGGETENYKIETSPESQITWIAKLSDYTNFSHRIGSSGAFSTSDLSGTGDTIIYVKGNENDTESTRSATITVDPQNINDPNVTDTVSVLAPPPPATLTLSVGGNELGNGLTTDYEYFAGYSYNSQTAVTFTIDSNYSVSSVSETSGNTDKFTTTWSAGGTSFTIAPSTNNTSGGTYTMVVTVTVASSPALSKTLRVNQSFYSIAAPTVDITETPSNFSNFADSSAYKQRITGRVITGTSVNSVRFTMYSSYFAFDTGRLGYSYSELGGYYTATADNPGTGYFYVDVYPTSVNSGTSQNDAIVYFEASNAGSGTGGTVSDNTTIVQNAAGPFTIDDWTGYITISSLGVISVGSNGNVTSVNIDTANFGTVTSSTPRSVQIDLNGIIPSGYTNTGGNLLNQIVSVTQPAAPRVVDGIIANQSDDDVTIDGSSTSVLMSVSDVYGYTDTAWSITEGTYDGTTRLQSFTISPSSGTGNESYIVLGFSQNTSGTQRRSEITVTGPTNSDTIILRQNSYTPPATFTLSTGSYGFFEGNEYIQTSSAHTLTMNVSGQHSYVSFYFDEPSITGSFHWKMLDFGTGDGGIGINFLDIGGGRRWTADAYNGSTEYKIQILPIEQNIASTNPEADAHDLWVTASLSHSGGTTKKYQLFRQNYYATPISWSRTPTSITWVYNDTTYDSVFVSFSNLTSNITWRAYVSPTTDFKISESSSSGYTTSLTGLQNTTLSTGKTIYVKPNAINTSTSNALTATITFSITDMGSNAGTTPSNLSVFLTQGVDPGSTDPCLLSGTKITMNDGSIKRVQNLQVGDVLKSLNIDGLSDGEAESLLFESEDLNYVESTAVVTGIKKHIVDKIYSFNEGLLQSSLEHQHFIRRDGIHKFLYSEKVRVGDYLMNELGEYIEITSIEVFQDIDYNVYKVDVEEHDVFFANGLLTHNKKIEF